MMKKSLQPTERSAESVKFAESAEDTRVVSNKKRTLKQGEAQSQELKQRWADPAYRQRMSIANKNAVIQSRICQLCDKEFQPTAKVQKYCGKQKEKGSCSWKAAKSSTTKWMAENPAKMKEYREKWWDNLIKDPERYAKYLARCRRKDLKRHGLTQEQYEIQLAIQNGVCAICRNPHGRALCGRSKDLAVDHDHLTGRLRGLLCDDCNLGLGLFRDDPQRLMNAALYLLAHNARPQNMIDTRRRMFGDDAIYDD